MSRLPYLAPVLLVSLLLSLSGSGTTNLSLLSDDVFEGASDYSPSSGGYEEDTQSAASAVRATCMALYNAARSGQADYETYLECKNEYYGVYDGAAGGLPD